MARRNIITAVLVVIAFGLGAGAGALGLLWATGGLETESAAVEDIVPTLSLDTPTPDGGRVIATQVAQINARLDGIAEQIAVLATGVVESGQTTGDAPPAREAVPSPTATPASPAAAGLERGLYRISPDESEVRFLIDEVLAGSTNTVRAVTRRVAGDVVIDFANPPASTVGAIAINARTFRTDQEFRDDSIRGHILETDTYEFITFRPTGLVGLPESPVAIGATLDFQIMGDLTVKATTRSVTFDASVTVVDGERLEGLARAAVRYTDYGITIRTPPLVSSVSEDVILEIAFVALRVAA
jgi:polyisoprenoid-binding protein YceI